MSGAASAFNFCPWCGRSIGQDQSPGKVVTCKHCGLPIGKPDPPKKQVIDQTQQVIQSGSAARCPLCQQVVQVKASGTGRAFVPHYRGGEKKICPNSGKPVQ
jgi:DNA-directed RNA polymerase subunit RPC12/RpoP